MRNAPIILLFLIVPGAWAQKSSASMIFFNDLRDCAASLGGWKCIELDLSSEAAPDNDSTKVYEYSWNFGDGTRVRGSKIEHCYDGFGSYQVTMDLIDTESNTVIRNELSSTLELFPEVFPSIVTKTENLPPGHMEFSFKDSEVGNFLPDRVYWRIGSSFYEGTSVVHSFPLAGIYRVEMAVEKNMDFLGTMTACASIEVTIAESDLWTAELMKFIETVRTQSNTGPFATDDVACYIKSLKGEEQKIIPLKTLMSELRLREGEAYELILFSGNHFSEKKVLDTRGINGNDLYTALKDTVSAFVRAPLIFFRPVRFEKNDTQKVIDELNLKETAELLRQHPFFRIEIGAYIHTGSRVSKGIANSLSRASVVKESLMKYGVAPERIRIASPEFNRALLNTCSAAVNCDWENEELNGKVEFRITGTTSL
jgi:hypothetical protein